MGKGQHAPHRSVVQSQIKSFSFTCPFLQSKESAHPDTPIHSLMELQRISAFF